MRRDFTLDAYARLCAAIQSLDCPVLTIRAFLDAGQPQTACIVLRHDVDRAVERAVRMAKLERTYDIMATYYFRTTRSVFQPDAIMQVHELGHEVGYHYEVLVKSRGNMERALVRFEQELADFRTLVPVHTASMHGSPLFPWNNLDLWNKHDVSNYGLTGEAYLDVDYSAAYYFTDTGRSWDTTRYNIRDHTPSRMPEQPVRTTSDLIRFLQIGADAPVFINAHPNRWTVGLAAWSMSAATDWVINRAKWSIATVRQHVLR